MTRHFSGFSLIELLIALTVVLVLSTMTFQMFHQNERVIRDQTLIMEMQQTARVTASQIADEIRMAGQGVPIYASSFDPAPSEAIAVILGSSTSSRIDFRAGLSTVEATPSVSAPSDFSLGVAQTVFLTPTSGFAAGKYAYVSGPGTNSSWNWFRAEVSGVTPTSLELIPRNFGSGSTAVHFVAAATFSLEEAVSIYLSAGSVRRATATNLSNPSSPVWSAANEIGKNVTALTFTYYDRAGNPILPSSLAKRAAIAKVDIQLTVQVSGPLSNGTRPTYSLALTSIPRNPRLLRPM
jgi:prepilin-type N-terminal cleavage/methylation domain-containing protein